MTIQLPDYPRIENEAYYTPEWVTQALMRTAQFPLDASVYEPACGAGDMVKVLAGYFANVVYSDITHPGGDFLLCDRLPDGCKGVITNPPYGTGGILGHKFVKKALELTEPTAGFVCMLMRSSFRFAKTRRDIFCDNPTWVAEVTLLQRVKWANLPDVASPGPWNQMSWFIWDWAHDGSKPIIVDYHPDDEEQV
jgi:hypothetical protein